MIRKRNDSVKPGCGIDGTKGENFGARVSSEFDHNMDEFNLRSAHPERSYSRNSDGKAGDRWMEKATEQPLKNVQDVGYSWSKRDIWSDVNENDGPHSGFSAAVRAGVNRSQED
jgi:hypothetical protein